MRKWSQTDHYYWRNFFTKLYLVSIAKGKDPNTRVKMHQTFLFYFYRYLPYIYWVVASLDILCSNSLNLKNKITKIEHKKIFCNPSKILKNISRLINICLKYLMTPTKTLCPPPSYIINVQSLNESSEV